MLGMLNVMEHFDLTTPSGVPSNETRTGLNMHRITEAMKFAFGARTEISDPDAAFMDDKRKERVQGFSQRKWAEDVVQELTDVSRVADRAGEGSRLTFVFAQNTTHTADYYHPVFDVLKDSGTTHMSIADRWGGAVALTST
jgi:gamma-glutamyltranspeptidase/glutathione hydrolase/leukotriene-C4 hydrolase